MEIFEVVYHDAPGLFAPMATGKLFSSKEEAKKYIDDKNQKEMSYFEEFHPKYYEQNPYSTPYYALRTLKVDK